MALFQPTYVLPDARQGLGEGTADVTQGLTVSWHINGASAMTKFQIVISLNDSASTQKYSTGELTAGCPAYGTAPDGEMLFFSYTIPAATLRSAGITNGNEYKLLITQWWSASDSVTQTSASAFTAKAAPVLGIGSIGTVDTRYYTFTGSYSQAQGDVLNWFRWQIAVSGNEDAPLLDTGNISGTMDISCAYDGFFSGTRYAVRLTAQTESGVEADTGWVYFSVQYDMPAVSGSISAQCAKRTDAVYVEWSGVAYIPGTASGPYTITDGVLNLPAGSSVVWNRINDQPLSFTPPWSFLWRATLSAPAAALVTIGQTGGNLVLGYDGSALTLSKGGTVLASQSGITGNPTVTVILTPDMLYIRSGRLGGGLYPSATLYPAANLYPRADTESISDRWSMAVSYTQQNVTAVTLGGAQSCDYVEVAVGTVSQETITAAWVNGSYEPGLSESDYMVADFSEGLNAGNLDIGGDTIEGYALYRRQGDAEILTHIADVARDVTSVYDYSARSQQGPYTYYLFPIGSETYISQSLASKPISPIFWNWTLLECQEAAEGFQVLAEYRFRNNVSTGAMSNHNAPGVLENFTRYPTVQRSPQNYRGGTLSALTGYIRRSGGSLTYTDTLAIRDAIYAMSTTENALFLKNRKGDLLRVRISEAVTMQTSDGTREQAQTVSISWVETGSAERVSLWAYLSAAQNSPGSGGGVPSGAIIPLVATENGIYRAPAGVDGYNPVTVSVAGTDTGDATATEAQIILPYTAYARGRKLTGAMEDVNETAF